MFSFISTNASSKLPCVGTCKGYFVYKTCETSDRISPGSCTFFSGWIFLHNQVQVWVTRVYKGVIVEHCCPMRHPDPLKWFLPKHTAKIFSQENVPCLPDALQRCHGCTEPCVENGFQWFQVVSKYVLSHFL